MNQDETTRHWSFTAFEWVVRDVRKLRDFVERGTPQAKDAEGSNENAETELRDSFEILNESPMLGDGKFKLEIARTPLSTDSIPGAATTPTLSLYVTCLMLDYANAEYELSASILAAIKCQDDRVGERRARANWIWENWQNEWAFRQENEVWEYPLPSLTTLLENPRIDQTDSFVICIQIHTPVGPFFPQHPSAYYVPRDLLDGLESSLDNSNTGDVQFVCLERMPQDLRQAHSSVSPSPSAHSLRSSASSSYSPFQSHSTVRKRIIYAHSDIITRRSDYFSTMLSSSFSENMATSERKIYVITVEEADFVTIYWLLKWVYADWVLFTENDDPRAAVDGVGAGWSARWLNARNVIGEWDWKTFSKTGSADELSVSGRDEVRSAASGESARSVGEGREPIDDKGKQTLRVNVSSSSSSMRSTPQRPAPSGKTPQSSPPASRSGNSISRRGGAPIPIAIPNQSSSSRSKTAPLPIPVSAPHYPLSPRNQRQHVHTSGVSSTPDPHAHPTPAPPPASALSMYQIAHRYGMPGLASLALEHIMSTITPQTSFALLLATSVWEELHSLIEDYVVEKWEEVSVSGEFERCCEEVASGEWGPDGGKTLMTLFRRLRSPTAFPYSRN